MQPDHHSQLEGHSAADRAELALMTDLSLREHGDQLLAACRLASMIYQNRLATGLPMAESAPWPASTWQFLKAQASHVRRSSHS
ncbi:MAG: hypothetical protein ACKV2Q_21670 [Planctomycetaceae bacterium]